MDSTSWEQVVASDTRVRDLARRTMLEPEAARGDDNTLWVTIQSSIHTLNRRFSRTAYPMQVFEADVHHINYLFVLAAQHIDAHHPGQDRLTRIMLWARELGVLSRAIKKPPSSSAENLAVSPNDGSPAAATTQHQDLKEEAVTTDGRLWTDLPFFAQDLQDAWHKMMTPKAPHPQRRNLTAALARLAGISVCDDVFSDIGLDLMNLALNQIKPVTGETSSTFKSIHNSLELEEMLQLVYIWLRYAGNKLLALCLADAPRKSLSWGRDSSTSAQNLTDNLGSHDGLALGYSKTAYLSWREKLALIQSTSEDEASETAKLCANIMAGSWDVTLGLHD